MCGIVGYIGNNNTVPILLDGLSKLEYRGYDSAGISVFDNGSLKTLKVKGMLENLKLRINNTNIIGNAGIGHTRWATHGEPSDTNSHPHTNTAGSIAVVHNGIIENYIELKEELQKKDYEFISDTDTEVIAHLLDLYYKELNNVQDAVYKTISRLEGSYALGILFNDLPDTLIALRKDSPLIVGVGSEGNYIASDVPAILNRTRNVYMIDNGELILIKKDSVLIYSTDKKVITKELTRITWDIDAAEKSGYDHFMLKEIYEQPQVLKNTVTPKLKGNIDNIFPLKRDYINSIDKINIVGCGSAYHAGLIGKYLIQRMCRMNVTSEIASEFRYNMPVIDEKTLVVIISQSGETADTLAALRLAREKNAKTLAIVNVVGSSIAREADEVVLTNAGPEIAVASTKAFSSQVACMYLLTCHIALMRDMMSKSEFSILKEEILRLPELADKILAEANKIKLFMKKYLNVKNVFYIGRGLDYMTAMEGSLKLKEIAYVHSEPYAAGELKHGPIALIEDTTLIVGIVTQDELRTKTAANIKECKSRGAKVLAIACEDDDTVQKYTDDVFYIPKTNPMLTPVLANIPQQLFSYYMSLELGYNVDKPRNLAKSVTVE